MHTQPNMDNLLKQTLAPDAKPSAALNQRVDRIIHTSGQQARSMPVRRTALIALALVLCLGATAFAAMRLLSPAEVAQSLHAPALAEAFASNDAILIDESITQNGTTVTLLGIISGKGLTALADDEIDAERTYAVVALRSDDPAFQSYETRGSLFISPLIRGVTPWQVNIASMGGGYTEHMIDDVLYRIIDCDTVELFADKGLYLCVSDTSFYDINAYQYDEATGEIQPNPDYAGLNALFTLPIPADKADPAQAEAYLTALTAPSPAEEIDPDMQALMERLADFDPTQDGIPVEGSRQTLVPDADGMVSYAYEGAVTETLVDAVFPDEEAGYAPIFSFSTDDEGAVRMLVLHRDEDGTLSAMLYDLKPE